MADEEYVPGLVRWLVVVFIATVILVAAVIRPDQGIDRPGPLGILTFDLWLHAGSYAVLELAVIYAVVGGRGPPIVDPAVTTVFVIIYGGLVEALQLTIVYRTFSTADLLANTVGVLLALALYELGAALVRREAPRIT